MPVLRRMIEFTRIFRSISGAWSVTRASLLVVAVAATEGIGLALLVPLLVLLGGASEAGGRFGEVVKHVFEQIGLSLSLPALLLTFVGLVVARALLLAWRNLSLAELRLNFTSALRERVYQAIADAKWQFLMSQRLSNLQEILTSGTDRIGVGTRSFLELPATFVVAAVQVAIALAVSPLLTVFVLCWSGLLFLLVRRRFTASYEEGERFLAVHRAAFGEISDFLHALKIAKSHGAESRHVNVFYAAIWRQREQTLAFERSVALTGSSIQIGAAVTLSLFLYVAVTFAHADMTSLLVLVVIFSRLTPLIGQFQNGWHAVIRMLPAFDHMIDLQKRCAEAAETVPASASRIPVRPELRVSNVGFRYGSPGSAGTLDGIDLFIPAGSTLAIVGATGAGKSTLGDILLGLLTPETGTVLVEGMPLTGSLLARWRRSVGYVPQDNFLFNDTVRANLLWAQPEASEQDLLWALSVSAADEFIARLPRGLDTEIGERGVRLSGGERQRLGLARAVLPRPALLLLDEATSALDAETERAVQAAVEKLRGRMTIVMIAHRLSTIRHADQIVVLDKGKIVQSGTWEALMRDPQRAFVTLFGDSGEIRR